MPEANVPAEITSAFTVINNEEEKRREKAQPSVRSVNVVRPQPRAPAAPAPAPLADPAMGAQPAARTLLDPKFSRALDFKLRRLKEKEILQANLRRPTRFRPRTNLAASNPNISLQEQTSPGKHSQSHPRIDIIPPEEDKYKISPKMDKSPSPGCKSRIRKISGSNDGDKPRFITTVKTGQFLLPPPEVASLLGLETLYPPQEREKIVYSYASKPKAVVARQKRSVLPEKKTSEMNGVVPGMDQSRTGAGTGAGAGGGRVHAGHVFSGVRALVAGVVGMHRLVERRDQLGSLGAPYSNVMHDKRVVRGSTFASHAHAAGDGAESAAGRAARTRRRALARRAAAARLRPGTPPPAPGRRHHPIQTDYYLEELFDKGVEMEVGVQTDLFVDRPATPVYVPAKTGADAATQIQPGDLFDFELEVQPILEVLVGKTAEQALGEVAQEEELAALREHQRRYCELRDAERAERARLAHQDLRLTQEKERRVAEARVAGAAGAGARARAAAAALVQGHVAALVPGVLAGLRRQGYVLQRTRAALGDEFMPWLVEEVSREVESLITSRDLLTEIVRSVVEARAELHGAPGASAPGTARAPAPAPAPDSPATTDSERAHEESEQSEQ